MEQTETVPKISVLMCVYNGERFLQEAVISILEQDFTDFEIIVVDDGSTDSSLKMLEDFARDDPRVRPIAAEHAGIAASLDHGLSHCRGEYVARMDADDISPPYRLSEQVAYLEANPDAVLVGGVAQGIDEHGNRRGITSAGRHTVTNLSMFPPKVALSMQGLTLFRRQELIDCGGYRKAFDLAEDYDLFIRLGTFGRFHNPDRVMLYYRQHDGSTSRTKTVAQERSAALSEVCALEVYNGRPDPVKAVSEDELDDYLVSRIGRRLFDAYLRFRVWRRGLNDYVNRSEYGTWRVFLDVVSLHPETLFSMNYHYLRYRMLAGLVRVSLLRGFASAKGMLRSPAK